LPCGVRRPLNDDSSGYQRKKSVAVKIGRGLRRRTTENEIGEGAGNHVIERGIGWRTKYGPSPWARGGGMRGGAGPGKSTEKFTK